MAGNELRPVGGLYGMPGVTYPLGENGSHSADDTSYMSDTACASDFF